MSAPHTDPASLARLDRPRRAFEPLTRRIVHAVLNRYLPDPPPESPIIEIGSGLGQLRVWLPDRLRTRVVHSEPNPAYLAELCRRYPEAQARSADAYHLPWPDGSLHAVLGLCVFDTLEESPRFCDELRRVLAPGGRFIHILDLGTDLGSLFRELVADGRIPLPNFLDRPGPHDDMVLTPWPSFTALVATLERDRHPHAARLRAHAGMFDPREFDPYAAAQKFMAMISDPAALATMKGLLASVARSLPVEAFSSFGHVKRRMEELFVPTAGFRVELSEVVAAREVMPRDPGIHPPAAFLGRCVGKTMTRERVPAELSGIPVTALEGLGDRRDAIPTSDTIVVEAAAFVFVTVRRED